MLPENSLASFSERGDWIHTGVNFFTPQMKNSLSVGITQITAVVPESSVVAMTFPNFYNVLLIELVCRRLCFLLL